MKVPIAVGFGAVLAWNIYVIARIAGVLREIRRDQERREQD